jgi:hypothetical protein
MKLLRQSTAATPGIGPFVDTTGAAATGLTITQTDVVLSKGGSTTYAAKNDATAATHRSGGVYSVPLDATDTATLGPITIVVNKAGSLPLKDVWTVLPANVYDSLVSTDKLQVDTVELNSVAASAVNLEKSASVIVRGTSTNTGFTATTTIFEASDITEATADHYKGRVVVFTSGALLGQATAITAYALSSGRGRFTINATTEAIPNATTFVIV